MTQADREFLDAVLRAAAPLDAQPLTQSLPPEVKRQAEQRLSEVLRPDAA